MGDSWYPPASDYWFDLGSFDYPIRYGDFFEAPDLPECKTGKGEPWVGVLVIHPSCELGAKATPKTEVLVARVNRVSDMSAAHRPAVRTGFQERDGEILVAHANTFWLAPLSAAPEVDFFADFRRCQRVPLSTLVAAGRKGAMTHEGRVHLIRREIYFKYRWLLAVAEVRQTEAQRVSEDDQFAGPRPDWPPTS